MSTVIYLKEYRQMKNPSRSKEDVQEIPAPEGCQCTDMRKFILRMLSLCFEILQKFPEKS